MSKICDTEDVSKVENNSEKKEEESPFLKKSENTDIKVDDEKDSIHKRQQDEIDHKTKESATFSRHVKLYFLLPSTGRLEQRGSGKMMILQTRSKLFKVLMIRDQLMLKGADHYIAPSANLVKAVAVPNSWIWVAVDDKSDAEENYKRTTYFATFKDAKEAEEFKLAYEKAQENNRAVFKEIKEEIEKNNK